MAKDRIQFQTLLEVTSGLTVYYQPPVNVEMVFPCIVYELDDINIKFAGNHPYRNTTRYQVTHISRDPRSPVIDKLALLPMCTFSRHFVIDRLNHDVFRIYF